MKSLITTTVLAALLPAAAFAGPADTFDPDKKPEAPTVDLPNPEDDTRTYAGVGSGIAYSERGTGEFGGSMSFSAASDGLSLSADPMVGYFLFDNLELSGIVGVRHLSVADEATSQLSFMVEPSLHVPINDGLFFVAGAGGGLALSDALTPGDGPGMRAGLALAPRTGLQVLIGRSGLLNIGARYAAVLSDADARLQATDSVAVIGFTNQFDIQAGYTVMF